MVLKLFLCDRHWTESCLPIILLIYDAYLLEKAITHEWQGIFTIATF